MADFETGAVRSSDADDLPYFLITPIGMRRLRLAYTKHNFTIQYTAQQRMASAEDMIYRYLGGCRNTFDILAEAAMHICEAIHITDGGIPRIPNQFNTISPQGLRRLARTYHEGRIKYSAYNCEKGFPVYDLLNHAIKHIEDSFDLKQDEDDYGHALWNVMMSMHSEELWPHLNKGTLRGPNCDVTEILAFNAISRQEISAGYTSSTLQHAQ